MDVPGQPQKQVGQVTVYHEQQSEVWKGACGQKKTGLT